MPFHSVQLVQESKIPEAPYVSPKDDPMRIYAVARSMEDICNSTKVMGLSACQVGLPWNMFVARVGFRGERPEFRYFVDCSYESSSDFKSFSVEACLSLPGEFHRIKRHDSVVVTGLVLIAGDEGVSFDCFQEEFSGIDSVLMQHEIDHCGGRLKMIDNIGERVYFE